MVPGEQISEAELAAFADGSLSPRRRAQVTVLLVVPPPQGRIATWLRAGHTCVVPGVRITRHELSELAAWHGSMDSARRHTGLSPPPHRLAP